MIDRRSEIEGDGEPPDLDTANEPEPEWAEGIRRGRRERAERLRRELGRPGDASEEPPP